MKPAGDSQVAYIDCYRFDFPAGDPQSTASYQKLMQPVFDFELPPSDKELPFFANAQICALPDVTVLLAHACRLLGAHAPIATAARGVAASQAVIDAELVKCDGDDNPDFYALLFGRPGRLCAWCFDLLMLNGKDLRQLPLVDRRRMLAEILKGDVLRYSAHFDDGEKLLEAAAARGLHRIEAAIGALRRRRAERLAQDKDGGVARGEPRSARVLPAKSLT